MSDTPEKKPSKTVSDVSEALKNMGNAKATPDQIAQVAKQAYGASKNKDNNNS